MFEKEAEEIEKEAMKWVKDVYYWYVDQKETIFDGKTLEQIINEVKRSFGKGLTLIEKVTMFLNFVENNNGIIPPQPRGKEFGEKFLLLTKEEVKTSHLFGPGPEHPNLDAMLGDYLAVAVSDLSLYNTAEERDRFVGVHAGLTEAEMRIPLIAISIP